MPIYELSSKEIKMLLDDVVSDCCPPSYEWRKTCGIANGKEKTCMGCWVKYFKQHLIEEERE